VDVNEEAKRAWLARHDSPTWRRAVAESMRLPPGSLNPSGGAVDSVATTEATPQHANGVENVSEQATRACLARNELPSWGRRTAAERTALMPVAADAIGGTIRGFPTSQNVDAATLGVAIATASGLHIDITTSESCETVPTCLDAHPHSTAEDVLASKLGATLQSGNLETGQRGLCARLGQSAPDRPANILDNDPGSTARKALLQSYVNDESVTRGTSIPEELHEELHLDKVQDVWLAHEEALFHGLVVKECTKGEQQVGASAFDLVLAPETQSYLAEKQRDRTQQLAIEGSELARDGLRAMQYWFAGAGSTEASDEYAKPGANTTSQALQAHAHAFGARVADVLRDAAGEVVRATQADFAAYATLRRTGRLPTIMEEIRELAPALPAELADCNPLHALAGGGRLGSFAQQGAPSLQRATRLRRREREASQRQVALARAVAARASKDGSDLFVAGLLPALRAVGKVATNRAPLPPLIFGVHNNHTSASADLGLELAETMRDEYVRSAAHLRANSPLGVAFDKAVDGTTQRIARSVTSGSSSLPGREVVLERLAAVQRAGGVVVDTCSPDGIGAVDTAQGSGVPQPIVSGVKVQTLPLTRPSSMQPGAVGRHGVSATPEGSAVMHSAGTMLHRPSYTCDQSAAIPVHGFEASAATRMWPTNEAIAPRATIWPRTPRQQRHGQGLAYELAADPSSCSRRNEYNLHGEKLMGSIALEGLDSDVVDVAAAVEVHDQEHALERLFVFLDRAMFVAEVQAQRISWMIHILAFEALTEDARAWMPLRSYSRTQELMRRHQEAEASKLVLDALILILGRE